MNPYLKIILFGAAIWVIAFIVGTPLYEDSKPILNVLLTQNIFYLVGTITVLYFGYNYLKHASADYVREGVILGISWVVIISCLDLAILVQMLGLLSFNSWVQEIFPMLLAFPIMTIALGYAMKSKSL